MSVRANFKVDCLCSPVECMNMYAVAEGEAADGGGGDGGAAAM